MFHRQDSPVLCLAEPTDPSAAGAAPAVAGAAAFGAGGGGTAGTGGKGTVRGSRGSSSKPGGGRQERSSKESPGASWGFLVAAAWKSSEIWRGSKVESIFGEDQDVSPTKVIKL